MPLLVLARHRHRFRAVLDAASRLEREVLGGDVLPLGESPDDGLAQLVNLDAAERATATVRITAGDLARHRLAERMGAPMPGGPHVAQLSGLCADPRLGAREGRQALLELRACIGLLFRRHGWTCALGAGHDRHLQFFILSGMAVRLLAPPALLPGDSELSFAFLASDPDPPERVVELTAGRTCSLQDPDQDPSLFTRYGDRVVA